MKSFAVIGYNLSVDLVAAETGKHKISQLPVIVSVAT
jgi:hypothetical protein